MEEKQVTPIVRNRAIGTDDLYLGVKSLSNVSLTDRNFSQADNSFDSYLENLHRIARSAAIGGLPIPALVPTAGMLAHYPGLFNVNDLVAHVAFKIPPDAGSLTPSTWQIAAWLIEERFTNFTQGAQHVLKIRHFSSVAPVTPVPSIDRDIIVEPTGGVNTSSEFVVLPMVPDMQLNGLGTELVDGDALPVINGVTKGRRSLLYPLPFYSRINDGKGLVGVENSVEAAIFIFDSLAISAEASVTITPVYVTQDSLKTLDRLLGSFKNQKHA